MFVCDTDTDRAELVRQCANIGYDNIAGELTGGIDAWRAADQPVATTQLIEAASTRQQIIDVSQHNEYLDGHVSRGAGGRTSANRNAVSRVKM